MRQLCVGRLRSGDASRVRTLVPVLAEVLLPSLQGMDGVHFKPMFYLGWFVRGRATQFQIDPSGWWCGGGHGRWGSTDQGFSSKLLITFWFFAILH